MLYLKLSTLYIFFLLFWFSRRSSYFYSACVSRYSWWFSSLHMHPVVHSVWTTNYWSNKSLQNMMEDKDETKRESYGKNLSSESRFLEGLKEYIKYKNLYFIYFISNRNIIWQYTIIPYVQKIDTCLFYEICLRNRKKGWVRNYSLHILGSYLDIVYSIWNFR